LEANFATLTKANSVKIKVNNILGKVEIVEIPLYEDKKFNEINNSRSQGDKLSQKFRREFQIEIAKANIDTAKEDLVTVRDQLEKTEQQLNLESKKSEIIQDLEKDLRTKRGTKTKFISALEGRKKELKTRNKTSIEVSYFTEMAGHEIDEAIQKHGNLRIFMKDATGAEIYARLTGIKDQPILVDTSEKSDIKTPIIDSSISDPLPRPSIEKGKGAAFAAELQEKKRKIK